ncbi:aminotransferase class V-fold PLP-dependent enzyme [Psychromonas sp. Urea-02u-13]|uniref:aminotransferase class V-fold PLP-dependent enzyme n=1 Tax=Psychromonas sp. Urea-02u-13 TaxID=2058326 RepID=UPI000C31C6EC|nr:cysteine desulfurase [Psychromonas sp. Urea-02u-13]PKG39406.1 cysteine desulfurase CsdA [Psychromonas sp. Urea-02u-13]
MQNKLFSVNEFREQFPILDQQINDHPLIYLDNAATTQKPLAVVEAITHFYLNDNANVHRASHQLSNRATTVFENARETVCQFINASSSKEIIWTKGTTEGFNLLTNVFASQLNAGDEVIISTLEHHANIVPWQMLVESIGIVLKVIPLKEDNSLDLAAYQQLLNDKTKFVSVAHISNALGIINPIEEIITLAHQHDIKVIIDGAQAIAHMPVDVQALDCDYYLFSGHKLFAPTGVGILYGKQHLLDALPPWQGGGEMIKSVSFSETVYNELPFKFEAGTPNIAGAIGLAAAIEFLNHYDRKMMMLHEQMLLAVAEGALLAIPEVTVFSPGVPKSGAISFLVEDEHHSDIAMLLDAQGIAVRSGSHCAMPLLSALNCSGTVRVSFSLYNTLAEVKAFISALKDVISLLKE